MKRKFPPIVVKDDRGRILKTLKDERNYEIIRCLNCNKKFKTLKCQKRKFCSRACYFIFLKKKAKRIKNKCLFCKKVFYDFKKRKFCSKKCYINALKNGYVIKEAKSLKEYKCLYCGKIFKDWRERKFCSWQCYLQGIKKYPYLASNWKNKVQVFVCKVCGKEFKSREERFYCSRECYLKSFSSTLEEKIKNLLDLLKIDYIQQWRYRRWVVDFYLPYFKLIIECDGDYWHSKPETISKDKKRDEFFISLGYRILRLKEHEIKYKIDKCKEKILEKIGVN